MELYPKGMAGFRRFRELIEQEPEIKDRPDAVAVDHLNGDIVFDDVHFNYDDNKVVLEGINLNIRAVKLSLLSVHPVQVKQRFVHSFHDFMMSMKVQFLLTASIFAI